MDERLMKDEQPAGTRTSPPLDDPGLRLIFGRRSVRVYAPGKIEDAIVNGLLQSAMAAPSAMTKDPWRFVVVRNRGSLLALKAALPGGAMLATAEMAILVCGELDAAFDRKLSYLLQDCSAAIENLLLAAHAKGLGACWVGIHPDENAIREVKRLFALPNPITPIAAISLGLPGEQPEARTRYNEAFVHWEKWEGKKA